MGKTFILIINWNNAADTILCLESVLGLPDCQIAVLDNDSADDSVSILCAYFAERNVPYSVMELQELPEAGRIDDKVLVIMSPSNLGFAGGNNAMMRYLLTFYEPAYFWLLNNDAVADKLALQHLLCVMDADSKTAFAGCVILDFVKPDTIQSCGVTYYRYFGVSKLILKNATWSKLPKGAIPHSRIDFQHGASFLVRAEALAQIGLMDERFFLYFEEQDWQYTAKEHGYNNVLSEKSIVYHKGSVSTNNKKHLFFYYYNRSAVIFAKKHSGILVALFATSMLIGITIIRTRLNRRSLTWGLKGLFTPWTDKTL